MNNDTMRMAKEAGLAVESPSWGYTEHYHFAGFEPVIERFAELVHADAIAKEREACLKAIQQIGQHGIITQCVAAIRARGNTRNSAHTATVNASPRVESR